MYFQLSDLCWSWLYCTSSVKYCRGLCWSCRVGQVYAGGVDGNVHVKPVSSLPERVLSGIPSHSLANWSCCAPLKPLDDAVHVPSVGVAIWQAMVEGLHVDTGGVGGASVTVVLPSGQVTAIAQADCDWAWLAVAELVILFVLSAVSVQKLYHLPYKFFADNNMCMVWSQLAELYISIRYYWFSLS
jgi:hypothetical protein